MCSPHTGGFNVPQIVHELIGINSQRLAKNLELFLTLKLPPFWSRRLEE